MLARSSLAHRVAPMLVVAATVVGCEAVLGLGPEPDRDRASTGASTSVMASTGPGAEGGGGSGGESKAASTAAVTTGAGGKDPGAGGGDASPYAAAVLADGPLVYLRLGDARGTVAEAAAGDDGVYLDAEADGYGFGEPGAIANDVDTAVRFEGGGIDLGDAFDPSGTRPFTFEAWIKPLEAPPEYYQRIFSKEAATKQRQGVLLWLNEGLIRLERFQDGEVQYASTSSVPTGRFFHLVATFDGQQVDLHIDGVNVNEQVYGSIVSVSGALDPLTIGRTSYGANHPTFAVLDEVAVYDLALSPQRIAIHHAVGLGD